MNAGLLQLLGQPGHDFLGDTPYFKQLLRVPLKDVPYAPTECLVDTQGLLLADAYAEAAQVGYDTILRGWQVNVEVID